MSNNISISLRNVSKRYSMYPSVMHQIADVIGWYKFTKKPPPFSNFYALRNINLDIPKGSRIGIIGRNGSGKSTLLKLVTQNFSPSEGNIIVNGNVQALMSAGMGFHPELSGLENIKSSLLYTNTPLAKYDETVKDVVDFCELGEFINQPIRTYSLGMSARLQFACATAVHPDILIVDEVLGAGDAYFSSKCTLRMQKLVKENTSTLLLVSHSTQQVLQFCDEAIWINEGEVISKGDALSVVKDYEKFISLLSSKTDCQVVIPVPGGASYLKSDETQQALALSEDNSISSSDTEDSSVDHFIGDKHNNLFREIVAEKDNFISRWATIKGLKVRSVEYLDNHGNIVSTFQTHTSGNIKINFYAEEDGSFSFKGVVMIFNSDGVCITRFVSNEKTIYLKEGDEASITLRLSTVQLGAGERILSVALYKTLDLNNLEEVEAYDLLSRSFQLKITNPKLLNDPALFHHSAEWLDPKPTNLLSNREEKANIA